MSTKYEVTVFENGTREWRFNRQLHRTDGPAIEEGDGTKHWWLNGQRHRIDGPAVECSNGAKYCYLHGEFYSEAEFKKRVAHASAPVMATKCVPRGGCAVACPLALCLDKAWTLPFTVTGCADCPLGDGTPCRAGIRDPAGIDGVQCPVGRREVVLEMKCPAPDRT